MLENLSSESDWDLIAGLMAFQAGKGGGNADKVSEPAELPGGVAGLGGSQ